MESSGQKVGNCEDGGECLRLKDEQFHLLVLLAGTWGYRARSALQKYLKVACRLLPQSHLNYISITSMLWIDTIYHEFIKLIVGDDITAFGTKS